MLKIAVLGGSFDPVHNAHIQMAQCAFDEFNIDKIIFVPAYKPPHKSDLIADSQDRYNMLVSVVKKNPKYLIDCYELDLKKEVYSYQMLDYLKNKYEKSSIKMLIGSDSFNNLGSWRNAEYICKNYGFYVIRRPNVIIDKNSAYYDYCLFSNKVMSEISSTMIREKVKNKQDISNLVPKEVENYIKQNKIYFE